VLLRVTLWVPTVSGPYCLGSLLSISFCELISRSRVHSIRCFQGPYCPAHNVNRCGAMPFPTRRWFNRFRVSHCRIQESQLRSFEIKQKNLNSTQVFSLTHSHSLSGRGRAPRRRPICLQQSQRIQPTDVYLYCVNSSKRAWLWVHLNFGHLTGCSLSGCLPCTRQLLGCLPYTH